MASGRAPRTDYGTVLFHWLMVTSFAVALATGLRISSDEPSFRWLAVLDFILPSQNLWFWHILASIIFAGTFLGYAVYLLAARLGPRVRLDGARLSAMMRPGSARWGALGVFLMWVGFAAFAIEVITGPLIYFGQAGFALVLHRNAVWICLAFPFLHVLLHYAYGGLRQLLRIVRPARLVPPPPAPDVLALLADYVQQVEDMKKGLPATTPAPVPAEPAGSQRNPVLLASGAGAILLLASLFLGGNSAAVLHVPIIGPLGEFQPPAMDGDISDAVWSMAQPVSVMTSQGGGFGGDGESQIEVRAVHDGKNVYFAFSWADPTRSIKHFPLVKTEAGWRQVRSQSKAEREDQYAEDKFSVLLTNPTVPIVGAAITLSPHPLPGMPPSASGRGSHFTDGGIADVWVWRADHGGMVGMVDDAHFGPPAQPTTAQMEERQPYYGGFSPDPGDACTLDNFKETPDGLLPLWLPRNPAATSAELGEVHDSSDVGESEGAQWWLEPDEAVDYSPEWDAQLPVGTIVPGVLITCTPSGDIADVHGSARWSAGRWTLEVARPAETGSEMDIPIRSGTMMWLAAFDHSVARHTRHIRPLTLELE